MANPLLAERVAVITGASQGIGREIARSLHAFGAKVVLVDIDGDDAAKAAARELANHNVRVDAAQPGLIRAPMTAAMPPEVFAERDAAVPMKCAEGPAEVHGGRRL